MLQATWKGYNGMQEEGFTGYQAGDSAFCYIEIFDAQIPKEEGQKILEGIVATLNEMRPGSLSSFEEAVNQSLKKDSLPLDFSLALGYRVESVLYLKTVGSGSISLKRGNHYATIITGNNVASGYLQEGDVFIFSTDYFLKEMKGEEHIRKILHGKNPLPELEEKMKAFYEGAEDGGGFIVAAFRPQAQVPQEAEYALPIAAMPQATSSVQAKKRLQLPDIKSYFAGWEKKKIIGNAVILVLLVALLLNIGRLFGNKQKAVQESKIDSLKSQIESEAAAWSDSGDLQHELGVISTLRQSLNEIKHNDKKVSTAELAAVTKTLDDFEAKVMKRETRTAEMFYDLSIEEKGAQGSAIALDGDTAAILNKQGRIYEFSLDNKSLQKKVLPEAANATLIGSYNGNIYFFKQGAGVYKIDTDGKLKRIISADGEWGSITDMQVYNGNIYLLDPGKENIYKYLVAENGYSDLIPYFKSGIPSLQNARMFSIDVAIYVNLSDSILKYLSGQQQDFAAQLPESDIALSKVYTTKDTDNVYGIDKAKGILYSWTKEEGTYVKQIQSAAFVKCDDFTIYKDAAYVLKGSTIFKVEL